MLIFQKYTKIERNIEDTFCSSRLFVTVNYFYFLVLGVSIIYIR